MNKKVYYGEYTLFHWIELILKHNIILPGYQRSFVWNREPMEKFIKSIQNGLYIPPVTLGAFISPEKTDNIILDGQQRLTSILLAYIGKYPKPGVFTKKVEPLYKDGNENAMDDINEEVIEWTFNELLHKHHIYLTESEILAHCDLEKYDNLSPEYKLSERFLRENYLGFSFIVPDTNNVVEQQKFYSSVFRNINQQGVELNGQDSRRALYYLDSELVEFFEPEFYSQAKVLQNSKPVRYDFVRSLAFLSQYAHQHSESKIALKCYSQDMLEAWYDDYINRVVADVDSTRFGKFSVLVGKSNIKRRMSLLKIHSIALGAIQNFNSIIEADMYHQGLIYVTIFMGKDIDASKYEQIKTEIQAKCDEFRRNDAHKRGPNKVTYLRTRIKKSIEIYSKYSKDAVQP